jgi:hypothetical protein
MGLPSYFQKIHQAHGLGTQGGRQAGQTTLGQWVRNGSRVKNGSRVRNGRLAGWAYGDTIQENITFTASRVRRIQKGSACDGVSLCRMVHGTGKWEWGNGDGEGSRNGHGSLGFGIWLEGR